MVLSANNTQFVFDTTVIHTVEIDNVGYSLMQVVITFVPALKRNPVTMPYALITTYNGSTVIPSFPALITEMQGFVATATTTSSNTVQVLSLPGIAAIKGDTGKSAYQYWLDRGNTGTESQFVSAMRGSDGRGVGRVTATTINFGNEGNYIEKTITDVLILSTSVIMFQMSGAEYALQGVQCQVVSITQGVGYTICAVASNGASGIMNINVLIF